MSRLACEDGVQNAVGQSVRQQHTSSMSGSFHAPGPANSDSPTVLSKHLSMFSQLAAMSPVVLHEFATWTVQNQMPAVEVVG